MLEDLENDSDREEDLIDPKHDAKLGQAVAAFLGGGDDDGHHVNDEASELIRRIRDRALVEQKYQHLDKRRDEDLEKRYLPLKENSSALHSTSDMSASSSRNFAPGTVPKPIQVDELYDEMDDWCCKLCVTSATIQ